jgi:hypothetical protein
MMGTEVTLTLSSDLYEAARRWSALTQHDLTKTLTDALTIVFSPIYTVPTGDRPVSSLSDNEILALSHARLNPTAGRRLDDLLERQREGALSAHERPELLALMQSYDHLWIRQSEALAEAVRRGLRKPLES